MFNTTLKLIKMSKGLTLRNKTHDSVVIGLEQYYPNFAGSNPVVVSWLFVLHLELKFNFFVFSQWVHFDITCAYVTSLHALNLHSAYSYQISVLKKLEYINVYLKLVILVAIKKNL